ncbi:MAG: DUF4159 domain-containing protein [Fuerstiella sp.]|nr:DUF4159 domain-containing protein [Fuerstiella sp.]
MSDIELRKLVITAIDHGVNYLRRVQHQESGAWGASSRNVVGMTSLAVLAQLNCDVPANAPQLRKGLRFLRRTSLAKLPPNSANYEASLLLMALCAAREYDIDRQQIQRLARVIQDSQVTQGPESGLWNYGLAHYSGPQGTPDRSNGQFAVLALRDAANAGVEIDQEVWERVRDHWETKQNPDGGWSYHTPLSDRGAAQLSIGSMTVAGLSTVSIAARMLHDDSDTDADGKVDCCAFHPPPASLTKGHNWLAVKGRFSTRNNPGQGQIHHLYYLYGLERAGRLTGVRLFGPHDWYRSGSRYLADPQYDARHEDGRWQTPSCKNPILATSYALLFLSKGLSRIVVNKLDYTSDPQTTDSNGEWNQHHLDIPNLIDHIDSTENQGWPPRLNSQVLTLSKLQEATAVSDMNQSPVLYISGSNAPVLSDQQVAWLRKYIDEGGFIYAQANCGKGSFDEGFRNLVTRMFPDEEASLTRLQPDHPVYRSQHLLKSSHFELYGVDFGCRSSVIYSPEDHACYWHKWMRHPPKDRSLRLNQRILRSIRLGVNVIAYATGKQPPEKLHDTTVQSEEPGDKITRGLLEIGQLRHDGGWNTAPRAVSNVLQGLNRTTGLGVSTKPRSVPLTLEALSEYPMAWMHGRFGFALQAEERNALRDYLSRGPVLIADACCGSKQFDTSFRDLMQRIYPDHPLRPIPDNHLMFTEATGFDVRKVLRRRLETQAATVSIQSQILAGPPRFEGIQINGQYVVIYSQYDLSCALENQASLACDGYLKEDAMKLAINLVLFVQDQEVTVDPLSANEVP